MAKSKGSRYDALKALEESIKSNDTSVNDLKNIDPKQYWTEYYNELFETELTYTEDPSVLQHVKHRFYKSPSEMVKKAIKYFVHCKINYDPITVTGLSLALGFSTRISINDYAALSEQWATTISRMKQVVENFAETMLYTKFSAGARFALINQGWEQKETRIIQEQSFEIDMKKPEHESES